LVSPVSAVILGEELISLCSALSLQGSLCSNSFERQINTPSEEKAGLLIALEDNVSLQGTGQECLLHIIKAFLFS
jgi:hypothetical protein